MTTRSDQLFIDTNVLVYAYIAQSPFHQVALAAIQNYYSAGTEIWISRQVLREFLVTVTRPQTFANPLQATVATQHVRLLQSRFRVAEDSVQVTANLLSVVEQINIGGKQIHDANIVATMQHYGISELLTHNVAHFARFGHLITVTPLI